MHVFYTLKFFIYSLTRRSVGKFSSIIFRLDPLLLIASLQAPLQLQPSSIILRSSLIILRPALHGISNHLWSPPPPSTTSASTSMEVCGQGSVHVSSPTSSTALSRSRAPVEVKFLKPNFFPDFFNYGIESIDVRRNWCYTKFMIYCCVRRNCFEI